MSKTVGIPGYRSKKIRDVCYAVVTLTDAVTGKRKDFLLGKHGTRESKAEYGRIIQEWECRGRRLLEADPQDLTINELALAYVEYAAGHYKPNEMGQCSELENIKQSIKLLRESFGHDNARDFGPKKLKIVRNAMVTKGWCRSVCNRQVNRLRRMFKWATEEELIPPSVYHGLRAVEPLRRGAPGVRDKEGIKPISVPIVEATKPFMSEVVAAMVDMQLLTGMRPGEVCIMRGCDLDVSGRIWIYRPFTHKTAHHGKQREIFIGPRAQQVLKPWLRTELQAFIFSPASAMQAHNERKRRERKTPLWPSHLKHQERKRKKHRRQEPGDHYVTMSYARAIIYACDRAFCPPEPLAKRAGETKKQWKARLNESERAELKRWKKEHRWHPNQLRHTAATLLRKEHGIELARIILGHSTAFTTEIYAEADKSQAMEVIGKVG